MKLFIKRQRSNIDAVAEYNIETKQCVVLKGSKISENIAFSERFRGAYTIEKMRKGVVKDNVLTKDVYFKSSSTAANFVTGSSTNGLTAWKTEDGRKLKEVLQEGMDE